MKQSQFYMPCQICLENEKTSKRWQNRLNYAKKDQILCDFEKLINFYNFKCELSFQNRFGEMGQMLTLFLLELIDSKKCISQRYVAIALRHKFYDITSSFVSICRNERELKGFEKIADFTNNLETKILVDDVLKKLTKSESEVVKLRYIGGLNCAEIARLKNVSRQDINQIKKRAFDKIKGLL
jgi:RNA polymerase sigma factor (sigma-70 family)